MTEARLLRLLGLTLILVGALGVWAILSGLFPAPHRDSTAAFPAAVGLGIALLHSNRPARSTDRKETP